MRSLRDHSQCRGHPSSAEEGCFKILLQRQRLGAISQLVERRADAVEQSQQQVCHWHVVAISVVVARLEPASEPASRQTGQVEVPMQVAVSHPATKKREAVIEECAITIGR